MARVVVMLGSVVAILLGAATVAQALSTVWNFEGVVRDCAPGGTPGACGMVLTDLGVDTGVPITGFLHVDDSVVGTVVDADTTRYDGSILAGEFVVGDLTLTLNQPGGLTAALNRSVVGSPPAGTSLYRIFSQGLAGVDSDPSGLFSLLFMTIDLEDSGQDVITTTDMPTSPPDLGDLDPYDSAAVGSQPIITSIAFNLDAERFFAEITSLTQTALPEPTTGLLLAIGLAFVARTDRDGRVRG